jgi:hypothetical protein
MKKTLVIITTFLITTNLVYSESQNSHRVDSHAPISVMGDHNHNKGEIMASYRYMSMDMKDTVEGDKDISSDSIITNKNFMMAPTSMQMQAHMIGLMYGLTSKSTVMIMGAYKLNSMESKNSMGMKMSMETSGISDPAISVINTIKKTHNSSWVGQVGLTLPVGSINETYSSMRVPYPMQLGSGTWDIIVGTTGFYFFETVSLGGTLNTKLRTGKNKYKYRLGNTLSMSAWVAKNVTNAWSISSKLMRYSNDDISGGDSSLNLMSSPTTSSNTGNVLYTLSVGSQVKFESFFDLGARLGFDFILPLYQHSDGIQMKHTQHFVVGYQQNF